MEQDIIENIKTSNNNKSNNEEELNDIEKQIRLF